MVRRAVCLALLLVAGPLRAGPPGGITTARLVYTRGPGAERCPDELAVREAVGVRLGYDPFRPEAARTVTATIAARRRALHADVKLADANGAVAGSRQLDAALDDCDELVASMALAIAIAVDPQSQLRPPPPPPAPPAITAEPAVPVPSEQPPAVVPPPPELPWMEPLPVLIAPEPEAPPVEERARFRAGLAVLGAAGSAPRVTGGLAFGGGVRWEWLSAVLEARADLPASATAAAGGSVSATFMSLALVPCFHRSWLVACALGSAGLLYGVGVAVPSTRTDLTSFGMAGVRLGAEVPLGRVLSLAFSADLAALLPRTHLQLRGEDVWTTSPVAGTLRAGVVADFP
jgi:hypothetical protein